jgi:hypothetical protein
MGTRRLIPLALALLLWGANAVSAQHVKETHTPTGDHESEAIDASKVMLPCTPVAAYWSGPPPTSGMPPGPELAVVSVQVRPKDARVHLDGRFVGRARYLDGKPGYLYLEPGSYRLELRHEGYRMVVVELEAVTACRYDLKHYMEKDRAQASGGTKDTYGKGMPFDRVYGPIDDPQKAVATNQKTGPDPSLRRDLDPGSGAADGSVRAPGASLRLEVSPEAATVSIDGVFVATGRELALMEGPLATTAGKHLVVVRAPGHAEASKNIELETGEVLELQFSLSEKGAN